MGQSTLLPAAVILLGAAVALFFAKPKPVQGWGEPDAAAVAGTGTADADTADADKAATDQADTAAAADTERAAAERG